MLFWQPNRCESDWEVEARPAPEAASGGDGNRLRSRVRDRLEIREVPPDTRSHFKALKFLRSGGFD